MKDDDKKHPSFGTISWGRVQGYRENMFMSSLPHHNYIEIEIAEARVERELNDTWVSTGKHHIRVALTENQFAQFITTPGRLPGIPCTISRLGGKLVEQPPPDEQMVQFRYELKESVKGVASQARKLEKSILGMLAGKTLRKGDLKKVLALATATVGDINSNLPYIVKRFNEHMDTVLHDAMARFEGHVKAKLERLGIDALAKGPKQLMGDDE